MKLNGDRIRILRERMGLSQEQLAKLAELSVAYINLVENGKPFRPYYDTVIGLAKALHVKPEEIILKQKAG